MVHHTFFFLGLLSALSCSPAVVCLSNIDCDDDERCIGGGCEKLEAGIVLSEVAGVRGLPLTLSLLDISVQSVALDGDALEILSTSADEIVVLLSEDAESGELTLQADVPYRVPLRVYAYESIPLPETPLTNAKPLAVEVDGQGRVWVNQEFHRDLHFLQRVDEEWQVQALPIPVPDIGPFASTIFGDRQTATSILGEDIDVDAQGNIWFTQGGASLYEGEFPNHSRIVRVVETPTGPRFDVFNVPEDQNEVIGLLIEGRNIWFAQGGAERAALWRFIPSTLLPDDGLFDFQTSLDAQICGRGEREGCYQKFPLPNASVHPAHLVADDEGDIWFTEFFGNAIACLDPETGIVTRYPLRASDEQTHALVGSGPWEILISDEGDIVFNEYFDNAVSFFDSARKDDPACTRLQDGHNACVHKRRVNDALEEIQIHSIVEDAQGRIWFTSASGEEENAPTSVGYVKEGNEVVTLPQLSLSGRGGDGQNGISIDEATSDLWFTEYFAESIGHLTLR